MATRNDRKITLAGDFNQSVEITNSLMNGESCSASDYGHAEGYMSNSEGKYSYAGGYSAYAKDNNCFVWSGKSTGENYISHGDGTFNVYTDSGMSDPLKKVYLDGATLDSRISDSFSSIYLNSNIFESENNWNAKNTFGGGNNGGIVLDGITLKGTVNSKINMEDGSDSSFSGTLKAKTTEYTSNDEGGVGTLCPVATTQYVKNVFSSSLNNISVDYVKRGMSSGRIGSSTKPVYIDQNGNATEIASDVVLRKSSSLNIGNAKRPIYMEGGYLRESSSNVGGHTQAMCLSGGILTALDGNVCNDKISLMYLNNGTFTKSTSSVGNNFRPVYLENGVLKPIGKNNAGNDHSIGTKTIPIYINTNGEFDTCDPYSGGGSGNSGITSVSVNNSTTVANNFLTAISAVTNSSTGAVTLNISRGRPKMENISGLLTEGGTVGKLTWSSNMISSLSSSCATLNTSCSKLSSSISSIHTYAPSVYSKIITSSLSGSGNVLVGYSLTAQTNAAGPKFTFTKGNVLDGVSATTGNGNFITSISKNGTNVASTKGYAVNSVVGNGSGTFVSSLNYDNAGKITVSYGTPPSGGGGSKVEFQIFYFSTGEKTVPGKGKYLFEGTFRQSGWTAVSICGVRILDSYWGLQLRDFWLDGDIVSAQVSNESSDSKKTDVSFYILAMKN